MKEQIIKIIKFILTSVVSLIIFGRFKLEVEIGEEE